MAPATTARPTPAATSSIAAAARAAALAAAQSARAQPPPSSATQEQAPSRATPPSSEPQAAEEVEEEEPAGPLAPEWELGPLTAPPRRRVRRGATVAEMRAEMRALGFAQEAEAAKGIAAVRAALKQAKEKARVQPMEGCSCPPTAAQVAAAPADVESVEDVRWHEGARQYLVHLGGGGDAATWVDEGVLPESALAAFDRERMLEADETDNSESSGDEGVDGE